MVFSHRPFCRISSRLATGHRLSRSGGYARSPRLIYYYSCFENVYWEFCATGKIFLINQRKKNKNAPRQTRDIFFVLPLGCNSRNTLPVSPTTISTGVIPPKQDVRGTDGTRATSSHRMRVIIGSSEPTRRGHRTPSPTSFVRRTIR